MPTQINHDAKHNIILDDDYERVQEGWQRKDSHTASSIASPTNVGSKLT